MLYFKGILSTVILLLLLRLSKLDDEVSDEKKVLVQNWLEKLEFEGSMIDIPKKLSDGVRVEEIVKIYFPSWMNVINLQSTNNVTAKTKNWLALNRIYFKRLDFEIDADFISDIVITRPGAIWKFLLILKAKLEKMKNAITLTSIVTESSQKSSQ